ncbi:hypothetical protein BMF94_5381 [Rhodotorula taiwanensis]|uniref:RNase III domain-containing protein n=1 Tax=Rhodotorula taiwanensis TaxID=741276 RepID=A0A2S5B4A9_9BASI|nr:hypothetical protein BMF94_5381 [Rhodotorula taiwanensis]
MSRPATSSVCAAIRTSRRSLASSVPSSSTNSRSTASIRSKRAEAQRHASTSAQPILAQRPAIPEEVIRRRPTSSSSEPIVADAAPTPSDEGVISDETHTFHAGGAAAPLTQQQLSLLYAYTTPPPESALAAFAARVSLPVAAAASSSTSASEPISLANELELVEQALIHESFWDGVRALQDSVALADSANRRFTNFHDAPLETTTQTTGGSVAHAHNGSLAALGNSLLGTFATELVLESFPHLPTRAAKAALTLYVGPKSLANVANLSWGVGPTRLERALVGKEDEGKVSRKDRAYGHLQQGRGGARKVGNEVGAKEGAAGPGLVRWNRKPMSPTKDAVLFEDALASVARALVGVVHETHGFAAARTFCRAHFLSRLLPPSASTFLASPAASSDILPLLKFSNPNRVLSLSLTSHGLPPLRHALLKESGRLTAHPTFVTGAFSGDVKLGEGFGSSLRMSEWRASEDALRRVYLGGGRVEGGAPTDAWAGAGEGAFKGWKNASGWTEVEHESR